MIKGSINIEGIAWEADLEKLSINQCEIFDYNVKLSVDTNCGIKDIYQVSLSATIEDKKFVKLKDSNILLLKGITNYKILAVENTPDNNINYLDTKSYFNTSFGDISYNHSNITIYIIDALFNLINNHEINCSLTYLFVFDKNSLTEGNTENSKEDTKYSLIDILKEFC